MGRWIEMVCDKCARRGPGTPVNRSGWARIEKIARKQGWLVRISVHAAHYLCPSCMGRKWK